MKDMPKPRYLTSDNKGRKLRRRVPEPLQDLAGKSQWIERIGTIPWKEAVERAHIFAVKTDASIRELEARLVKREKQSRRKEIAVDDDLFLQDFEAEQLALAYFHEKERKVQNAGGYLVDANDRELVDLIADAKQDLSEAVIVQRGGELYEDEQPRSKTNAKAAKLLVQYGYLDRKNLYSDGRFSLPEYMGADNQFKKLCRLLERADTELAARSLFALERNIQPNVNDVFFQPAANAGFDPQMATAKVQILLDEAIEKYLDRRRLEVSASRMADHNIPIRAMKEEFGAKTPIDQVTRQQCEELAELLITIPPYATNHYGEKVLRDTVNMYEKKHGEKPKRLKDARESLSIINDFFKFAVRQRWLEINPASEVEILTPKREKKFDAKNDGYQPYDLDDLQKIFMAPLYTGCKDDDAGYFKVGSRIVKRHRYWAPLIALFTGMRSGEILQLEKEDIRELNGVKFFSVTDEENVIHDFQNFTKSLKNINAVRDIPIHPELIKFGFLDWLDDKPSGRIFREALPGSNGKLSSRYSKHYNKFGQKCDVWVSRKKVFHSFRNNFNDALRHGQVPLEHRIAINGWEQQHKMDEIYGRGHKVSTLHAEICKLEYEGLNLSHLYINRKN